MKDLLTFDEFKEKVITISDEAKSIMSLNGIDVEKEVNLAMEQEYRDYLAANQQ